MASMAAIFNDRWRRRALPIFLWYQVQYPRQKLASHPEPFPMKIRKTKSKMAAIFEYEWRRQSGEEYLCRRPTHVQYSYLVRVPHAPQCEIILVTSITAENALS